MSYRNVVSSFSTSKNKASQKSKPKKEDNSDRIHFLHALSTIPVPSSLQVLLHNEGIHVEQVAANGKTQAARLKLSQDKFTLTLTATKLSTATTGSFFSAKTPLFQKFRAIDIGEMDRIQRGQATQQFEMAKKKVDKKLPRADLFRNISTETEKASNRASSTSTAEDTTTTPTMQLTKHNKNHSTSSSHSISSHASSSNNSNVLSGQHQSLLDPQRSFSIIFRGAQTLDLMVQQQQHASAADTSKKLRDELCACLTNILQAYQLARIRVTPEVLLLRYIWLYVVVDITKIDTTTTTTNSSSNAMAESNNKLSLRRGKINHKHETFSGHANASHWEKIFVAINFALRPKDLHNAYEQFGRVIGLDRTQRKRGLTFEQSATFLHKIKRDSWMVKPVQVIWNELFGEIMNNGKMRATVSENTFLTQFLQSCQGESGSTLTTVRMLFRKLHDMEGATVATGERRDLSRITKDQFEAYLFGITNDAFDPAKDELDMTDMNQPLSEYWINSSHNTYLIGDQYTSHSSVEMYSNALYRGCRCLELDIWDGGKSRSGTLTPVVWHGHTMTTKILFDEIIRTIKVFLNFHPDSFPIVLSFENHCSIAYQEVMAEQLVRILGDSLYIPKESTLFGPLPSPAQLRGMVVIKGRRPDGTEADAYDTDDEYDLSDDEDNGGPTSSMGDFTVQEELKAQRAKMRKKHKVAPELARLTLFHGHKLNTFEESTRAPNYFMHSFSENKVRSNCRHKLVEKWVVHNQTHMSRTYPAGSRVDSSNYNPLLAWSAGCQMVALNFQTQDAFLRLNDGRFRENGNCGYVLKPSSLMIKDGFSQVSSPMRLSVRVLSGSCLPKPKGRRTGDCIDPYVKVTVFDVVNGEKETVTTHQTEPVAQNGFFPIWGQSKFQFRVENWAVAMLQLTVHDKTKDEFIASSSIPISCLRRGIRSCKLYDSTNTRSGAFDFASLLLEIRMSQIVAEI